MCHMLRSKPGWFSSCLKSIRPRDVVSVLNVSVSRRSRDVFWNVSSRLGLEGWTSRSCLSLESLEKSDVSVSSRSRGFNSQSRLGLEDITFWSRSCDFHLVNIHAMHRGLRIYHEENNGSYPQETGCQVTDFTSWCFKLRHCGLKTFFGTSWPWRLNVSSRSWEFGKMERLGLVSVLRVKKMERLSLVSVLKVDRLGLVT